MYIISYIKAFNVFTFLFAKKVARNKYKYDKLYKIFYHILRLAKIVPKWENIASNSKWIKRLLYFLGNDFLDNYLTTIKALEKYAFTFTETTQNNDFCVT